MAVRSATASSAALGGGLQGSDIVNREKRIVEEGVLEVGAEDMMAVLDAINHGGKLSAVPALRRVPKIAAILSAVSRHRPSSQLRSNSLWIGKRRLKMKLRQ